MILRSFWFLISQFLSKLRFPPHLVPISCNDLNPRKYYGYNREVSVIFFQLKWAKQDCSWKIRCWECFKVQKDEKGWMVTRIDSNRLESESPRRCTFLRIVILLTVVPKIVDVKKRGLDEVSWFHHYSPLKSSTTSWKHPFSGGEREKVPFLEVFWEW